ncbi:hypothetical protein [uncultured Kocuria sp.]|uniref:hypothetical protein n=1 Tax=uncultured Kocuria sp. TaxID=259305 RepID=UPI002599553F|nr:hypothetical protein [uncultured Kocuria sp.]MCT1368402.1 hypothetical protein [Rothia sp. p3-SID1597]
MSITAAQTRQGITDALTGIHPNVTIYTGTVPETVPSWGIYIKPYIGLWVTTSSDDPFARAVSGLADIDAVRISVQTQIVAADEVGVYQLADLVRERLTNRRIGTGVILPDTFQQENAYILTDTSVTPSRPYLPLMWTIETQ